MVFLSSRRVEAAEEMYEKLCKKTAASSDAIFPLFAKSMKGGVQMPPFRPARVKKELLKIVVSCSR